MSKTQKKNKTKGLVLGWNVKGIQTFGHLMPDFIINVKCIVKSLNLELG